MRSINYHILPSILTLFQFHLRSGEGFERESHLQMTLTLPQMFSVEAPTRTRPIGTLL
jgi:hypothetical protein